MTTLRSLIGFLVLASGVLPAQQRFGVKHIANSVMRCNTNYASQYEYANVDLTSWFGMMAGWIGHHATLRSVYAQDEGATRLAIEASGLTPELPLQSHFASVLVPSTLMTFTAQNPIDVVLHVSMGASAHAASSLSWSSYVDIGNNGKKDVVSSGTTVTRDFRVRIDKTGLQVATSLSGQLVATGPARFSGSLEVTLLPLLEAVPYGRSCSSIVPILEGTTRYDGRAHLRAVTTTPNAQGARLIGTQKLLAKVPGTTCWLNTNIVVVLPLLTDSTGVHTTSWLLPKNIQITVQDVFASVVANQVQITTSNGLAIQPR